MVILPVTMPVVISEPVPEASDWMVRLAPEAIVMSLQVALEPEAITGLFATKGIMILLKLAGSIDPSQFEAVPQVVFVLPFHVLTPGRRNAYPLFVVPFIFQTFTKSHATFVNVVWVFMSAVVLAVAPVPVVCKDVWESKKLAVVVVPVGVPPIKPLLVGDIAPSYITFPVL